MAFKIVFQIAARTKVSNGVQIITISLEWELKDAKRCPKFLKVFDIVFKMAAQRCQKVFKSIQCILF